MNGETIYCAFQRMWTVTGFTPGQIVSDLWILFALYWLVSALKRKKTKQRESIAQRLVYIAPLLIAFYLLYHSDLQYNWLTARFVPHTRAVQWIGVAIMVAGLAFACWARIHLGTNWSGVVTLKEGHELIRTGPYRTIRHPIYTGILLGFLGNVIQVGQVRGLIALGVIWASFYIKARREESFLIQEFGPKFDEHSQHTGMFLPKLT
jgi:protein-S-isoprenylcysteine O-methyltransferase Ste14